MRNLLAGKETSKVLQASLKDMAANLAATTADLLGAVKDLAKN